MSRRGGRVALAVGALMVVLIAAAAAAQGLGGPAAPERQRVEIASSAEAPSRAHREDARARASAARRRRAQVRAARRTPAGRRARALRAPGRRGTLRVVPVPSRRARERALAGTPDARGAEEKRSRGSRAGLAAERTPGARRFSVAVEGGVRVDRHAFADTVERTLRSPRGWGGGFRRVDSGRIDFRVVLTSARLTDRMCFPLLTRGSYSCARDGVAVLNARRWRSGAASWGRGLGGYRRYMVNHEVGHVLGHGHLPCPAAGARAPVMMQQTKGVGACRPNAWPRPG